MRFKMAREGGEGCNAGREPSMEASRGRRTGRQGCDVFFKQYHDIL
jgi:hypothetical protein